MKKHKDAKIKVFTLWSPIGPRDSQMAATKATAYLPDRRAEQFWDLWSFGLNTYTKLLHYTGTQTAWNVFVVYKPQLRWGDPQYSLRTDIPNSPVCRTRGR